MVPEWADLYQKTVLVVAPNDTPNDFFENDISIQNSITFSDASDNGTFRMSFTKIRWNTS